MKGIPGKCSFTETCDIRMHRDKILNVANTMYDISKDCLDNPTLENCNDNQDTIRTSNTYK